MLYRADIDGLRAVAVLLVVLYHAGFAFIPGGFIGVDVFFVISGFLITNIIYRDIKNKTFKFKDFYTRRIRRILPAFYVFSFITLIVGYFLLLPSDYVELSKSFLAAASFVSNFFFWISSGGYFSGSAEEMPLLHTWSLSVEEQFYFIWPTILILMSRFFSSQIRVIIIAIIVGTSFALAQYLSSQLSVLISGASYFTIPTRIGELLLGSMVAMSPLFGKNFSRITLNFIATIGLLLILVPALTLTKQSTFPGINAFWPCLGTALVILSGLHRQGIISRLLSLKPLVFIGLISYSLYLWHWPIVAYLRYLQYEFTLWLSILLVILSIVLAYLSWKFVEIPCRKPKNTTFLKTTAIYFISPLAVCIVAFYIITNTGGFIDRLNSNQTYAIAKETSKYPSISNGWCHDIKSNYSDCIIGNKNGKIRAVLWGDSYAGSYTPFVDHLAQYSDLKITPVTVSSCTPFIIEKGNGADPKQCSDARNYVKKSLEERQYDVVIIAARLDSLYRSFRLNPDDYFDAIRFTSENSKKVIVLGQVPLFLKDTGSILMRKSFLDGLINEKIDFHETDSLVQTSNKKLKLFTDSLHNVDFIDTSFLFEDSNTYSPYKNGKMLYIDGGHLNISGSKELARAYVTSKQGSTYIKKLNLFLENNP